MSKNPKVDAFLHKLFGTTPGEGMQPKEAIAYSVARRNGMGPAPSRFHLIRRAGESQEV